ncbi:MAG: HlyC/CorC family transporter [Clostridia bacterium]|nr:HlyC/CorC family transporter [Clostridia bacterium]
MLLVQVILIALNAIFASAEIAVISLNEAKLDKLAEEGNKRAGRLAKMKRQPARFLAVIQVAITLSGFLGSAFAADNFAGPLVAWLIGLGVAIPTSTLNTIAVIVITLILSYFTLVLGELVPKRVAMRNSEKLALALSNLLFIMSKLFAPIVGLLTVSTNGVLRLLRIDPNADDEEVSEEDIRLMVDAGSEQGAIDSDEKEFIQNVFEFDDLSADDIATHRTEVTLLWIDETDEEWKRTIRNSEHTYYPVCNETVDDVIGVLNAKKYFRLENRDRDTVMKQAVSTAYFVPKTVKADVLFKNMKSSHNHFAVVLDEYGGMCGVISMNDLVEELVGDLGEITPNDEDAPIIERLDSRTWKISGNAPLRDVEDALEIPLPTEDHSTFNGLIFGALGSVPEDGSQFDLEAHGMTIRVRKVVEHQVRIAMVSLIDPPVEEEKEDEG